MADYSLKYLRWYQYTLELFPLWLIVAYNYIARQIYPPLMEFIIIALIIAPICGMILNKVGGHKAVYAAFPIIVLASYMFDFSIILSVILAGFLTIRMENRYIKPDQDNESVVLVITFLLAIFAYILQAATTDGFSTYYISLFIIQVFVWLAGRLIYYYVRDDYTWKQSSKKKVLVIASSLGGLGALTWLSYTLFPYIKFVISTLLYWAVSAFAWLANPLLEFVGGLNVEPPEVENENSGEQPTEFGERESNSDSSFFQVIFDYLIYTVIGLLVIAAIIGYMIYRRKLIAHQDQVRHQYDEDIEKEKLSNRKWFKRREKVTPPTHEVRKAYFDLEKWAAKHDLGRYQHETTYEWLRRLGIEDEVDDDVMVVYDRVRYREDIDVNEQLDDYYRAIEQIKKKLTAYNESKG